MVRWSRWATTTLILLFLPLLVAVALLSTTVGAVPLLNMTLIHTGDVRGRILPIDRFGSSCSLADALTRDCFGGVARRVSAVNSIRASVNNSVLVDAGNFFAGSLFHVKFKGDASREFLNMMAYDAISFGSADFSGGPSELGQFLSLVSPSTLRVSSNLDVSAEPLLAGKMMPWGVLNVSGHSVGILGAAPSNLLDISSAGSNVKLNPALSTEQHVRTALAQLQGAHPDCNVIILLSDDEESSVSIANFVFGIDIIVEATDRERRFNTSDPYPQVITSALGDPVLIVSVGKFGDWVGRLDVQFDANGRLVDWAGDGVHLTNDTVGDVQAWSRVVQLHTELEVFSQIVLGWLGNDVYGKRGSETDLSGCRWGDCPMGRLTTNAMLWKCTDCDVALVNAGGIRDSLPAGNVTRADLLNVFKFQDTMSTFTMQGTFLLQALEHGLERDNGKFLQTGGLRYAWNNETTKIVDAQILNRATNTYELLDVGKRYKLATGFFIRNGGDGYKFKEWGLGFNDFLPLLDEIVGDYIKAHSPVTDVPTKEQLAVCQVPVPEIGVDSSGQTQWDNDCRSIIALGKFDLLTRCATNQDVCSTFTADSEPWPHHPPLTVESCISCSGLGKCTNQECSCMTPNADTLYTGLVMVRGDRCDDTTYPYPKKEEETTTNRAEITNHQPMYVQVALCVVTAIVAILAGAILYYFRRTPVVRRSSPFFGYIQSVGALLGVGAILTLTQSCQTRATCSVFIWQTTLCFSLVFGALFVKQFRIFKIFLVTRLTKQPRLTDQVMLRYLFVWVSIPVTLLILYHFSADPPDVKVYALDATWEFYVGCNVSASNIFVLAILIYVFVLLLWGSYLSFKVRNVDDKFNESAALAMTIYNATITVAILLAIVSVLGRKEPEAVIAFSAVAVCYVIIFSFVALLTPKIKRLVYGDDVRASSLGASTAGAGGNSEMATSTRVLERGDIRNQIMRSPQRGRSSQVVPLNMDTLGSSGIRSVFSAESIEAKGPQQQQQQQEQQQHQSKPPAIATEGPVLDRPDLSGGGNSTTNVVTRAQLTALHNVADQAYALMREPVAVPISKVREQLNAFLHIVSTLPKPDRWKR